MFGIVQYSGRYKEGPEGLDFLPAPLLPQMHLSDQRK